MNESLLIKYSILQLAAPRYKLPKIVINLHRAVGGKAGKETQNQQTNKSITFWVSLNTNCSENNLPNRSDS
jgi:hypothetical protein